LRGRRFHNNEEVETAVRELLGVQEPDFYLEGIPRWTRCSNVLGDYVEK
jgi:hypothetical protein